MARRFSRQYPVALLARQASSYDDLVAEINKSGGKAIGVSTDVSDSASVQKAVQEIRKQYGEDAGAAAAVFNASGKFARKPFLDLTEEEFVGGFDVSV